MKRSAFLGSLAALPLILAASSGTARSVEPGACIELWFHEPLILYDLTGATFAGPTDTSLAVYSSGSVKISSASLLPGIGRAAVAYITPAEARNLAVELRAMGAHSLCDVPVSGADIPLKTLTVFGTGSDTFAHTFSWFNASAATSPIQQRLTEFISETFPEF